MSSLCIFIPLWQSWWSMVVHAKKGSATAHLGIQALSAPTLATVPAQHSGTKHPSHPPLSVSGEQTHKEQIFNFCWDNENWNQVPSRIFDRKFKMSIKASSVGSQNCLHYYWILSCFRPPPKLNIDIGKSKLTSKAISECFEHFLFCLNILNIHSAKRRSVDVSGIATKH